MPRQATEKEIMAEMKTYGTDLSTVPVKSLPSSIDRCCFIIVNNYKRADYFLGTGPLNDALSIAKVSKIENLTMYYLHNGTSKVFLSYLDKFFEIATAHLLVYYVGHGTNVKDLDGDEADGQDEAFVFDDSFVIDDVLNEHLIKYKNSTSQVTLITDACHSGSIWDLSNQKVVPAKVTSISAANDGETAKQTLQDNAEQGIFTYNFYKYFKQNPQATPNDLKLHLQEALSKYQQSIIIETTAPKSLDIHIFCDHTHNHGGNDDHDDHDDSHDEENNGTPAVVVVVANPNPPKKPKKQTTTTSSLSSNCCNLL